MKSLKERAALTAISRLINIVVGFFTQIIVTPLLVNGLGQYLYGVYSIISKTEGYMSFVDLRPSAILRYKLAVLQRQDSLNEGRKLVGAAIYISALTLPIIVLIGIVICYLFPYIFKISNEIVPVSRIAIICISVILGLKSFLGIPDAILRGKNEEYKGIFIEPIRCIIYVALVYVSIKYNYGILGVLFASFATFLIAFIIKLYFLRKHLADYKPLKPEKKQLLEFSKKGGWYLLSSFSFQLLQSLDVIIIGVFFNPIIVTVFSLSKAFSFRISEAIVTVIGSVGSGISSLISTNQKEKLANLRVQLIRINLVIGLFLLLYFHFFNAAFVGLWVGQDNFTGNNINILISLTIPFIILSMSSQLFIDALLLFRQKSISILITTILTILLSVVLSHYYGLTGIAFAILVGRIILWLIFEYLLSFIYDIRKIVFTNYKQNLPVFVFALMSITSVMLTNNINASSWLVFCIKSFLFFLALGPLVFLFVLSSEDRALLLKLKSSDRG